MIVPDGSDTPTTANEQPRDWAHYKQVSEVTKNVASIIAIVIGGGWVLFTFVSLKQREIAEIQVSRNSSRLSMDIEARVQSTPDGTCLFADVILENVGTRPVTISNRWGEPEDPDDPDSKKGYVPPLAVYKVEFKRSSGEVNNEKRGKEILKDSISGHPLTIPAKATNSATVTWGLIRVGEKRRIPFVVRLEESGVYLMVYRTFVGFKKEEQAIYREWTGKDRDGATWSARKYVVVNIGESNSNGGLAETEVQSNVSD